MKIMTLRAAREWRGWTQEELERLSGVMQTTISKIERGDVANPSNDTVARLEQALKIRRGTLVFGDQINAEQAS